MPNVLPLPRLPKHPVVIGAAFTGPAGFADTRTGTYWEVLSRIDGDNLRLQKALIAFRRRLERARVPRPGKWPDYVV